MILFHNSADGRINPRLNGERINGERCGAFSRLLRRFFFDSVTLLHFINELQHREFFFVNPYRRVYKFEHFITLDKILEKLFLT